MWGNGKIAVSGEFRTKGAGQIIFSILFIAFTFFSLPETYSQCNAIIGTNIDPAEGCNILTIQFSDLSSGVVSRTWNFGDGSPNVVAQNPVHSFTTGNRDTIFTVSLTITCASGSSTATKNVKVFANPLVSFSSNKPSVCAITDSICLDNNTNFSSSYSYLWNFGDGTISDKFHPCKVYSTPGTYDITLTVINDKGCLGTKTTAEIVKVERIPSTAFSVNAFTGCRPFNVVFTNNTDTIGNDYSNWTWDFGDGEPVFSGFEAKSHTYVNPGEYTVTLGTTNSLGCFNYSTQKITVKPAPVSSFIATSPVCQNDNLLVQYNGTYNSLPEFKWSFDSAVYVSGSGEGPYLVRWKEPGNKMINLTVIEDECSSSVSEKVQVSPIAKVLISISTTADTICSVETATFTASPANFANYAFYVNSNLVQQSGKNSYTGTGFHDHDKIYVKITDLNGCTEIVSDTLELKVFETPVIGLASSAVNDTICFNDVVTFGVAPAGLDEYNFYLGNTLVKTGSSPNFTISTLTNKDRIYATARKERCMSENSNSIITTVKDILPAPQVYCGNTTTGTIEFQWDEVKDAQAYEISLDNGAYSTPGSGPQGLSHLITGLSNNEEHTIKVRALDQGTCGIGMISNPVTCVAIDCLPIQFNLNNQKRDVCENENVSLSISDISIPDYKISWNNDPNSNSNIFNLTAATNDTVFVQVENVSSPQCPPTKKYFNITVSPRPVLTLVSSAPGNLVCDKTSVKFTASPADLKTYSFFDNNNLIKKGPDNYVDISNPLDGHRIEVSSDINGCFSQSLPLVINVNKPLKTPIANYISSDETSVLFGWDLIEGATGYMVSINGGNFITPSSGANGLKHLETSLFPGDAVTLTVIALGNGICGNSEISQPAIGYAEKCTAFTYSVITDHIICKGDSITMKIDDLNLSNYQIQWGNLLPSQSKTKIIKPLIDTTVLLTLKNTDKPYCPDQKSFIKIKVNSVPDSVNITSSDSDNEICENEKLKFTANPAGYDLYEFYSGFNKLTSGIDNFYQPIAWKNNQSIKARAINQGCTGPFGNEMITLVSSPLKTPQLNPGNSTANSVSFVWDSIPGATAYMISIDGAAYGNPSSGATGLIHNINGLTLGDSVKATVIAIGNEPCGNSMPSNIATAYAFDCEAISFTISPYAELCKGETVNLTLSDITPASYSVSWNGGAFGNITDISHSAQKDTIINLTVRNNNQLNCPVVNKYFELKVTDIPQITLNSDALNDTICNGQNLIFTALPQVYSKYEFYEGSNIIQDSVLSTYSLQNVTSAKNIYVKGFENGCTSQSSVKQIVVVTPPAIHLTADKSGEICQADMVNFTATPGFKTYVLNDPQGDLKTSATNSIGLMANSSKITVYAYDGYNCKSVSTDTIKFTVLPLPKVTIGCSVDTICFSEFATYIAEPEGLPGYIFYLNDVDELQSGTKNIYSIDTLRKLNTVSVIGIDNKGCKSLPSVSYFPFIYPYPGSKILSEANGVCLNSFIKLYINRDNLFPSASYYWSTGQTLDTINVSPVYSTKYSLYFNSTECSNKQLDAKTILVDRMTPPVAEAGDEVTICINDSTRLGATGGMKYEWNTAITLSDSLIADPYAKPLTTTTYLVKVTNEYCYSTDSVRVIVDLCLSDVTNPIPQIITPNNDGYNDFWIMDHIDYFSNNNVEIYNRWGNLVYRVSPYDNTWNGKNNKGADLPDGTYFYILDLGNGSARKTGYIIIHR